ncbi:MAG: chromosome segregation protein SMC [Deltaproteobacteria bacterium]|nr:chromosome segregation protein SMC [Deltaproteobacteria bacterium]
MRLKSLELIGFKSFVDRTVISFDAGATAIVGPNGSGKSNVCDSIRWVMGEQSAKHLRGSEMSDVIFNGSDARPATGMASVFLTFDNSDGRAPAEYASYSEITIGRRLYRSGESEYYINKVPCRLKDIIEFFLGTGVGTKAYSIVEQGQVERIVSAKPEERRQLLEEAAGISKFKMHRDSALRKIEATKQNLARLADIIAELEHQKNSLSRQARKAERYKEFADELKGLELSLSSHQYRKLSEDLVLLRDKLAKLTEEEASKGASIANEETLIDSTRIELTETERKLNSLQEKVYEHQNRMKLNEADIGFKTDQLASITARCEESAKAITELKAKALEMEAELKELNESKVNTDIELATFEEAVSAIQQKATELQNNYNNENAEIENLRRKVMEAIKIISESKARADHLERAEIDLAGKIARNQSEIDAIDKKIAEINSEALSARTDLDGMKGTKENLTVEMSSLTSDTDKIKAELLHNEAETSSLSQMLSVKKSRLASLAELRANFEGYNDGVRAVLKRRVESSEQNGILGTISEMIETEPHYETAVSAALGEKLQYVVVKSHQEGVEAIDYLKTQAVGRSTFIPLEVKLSEETPAPTAEGVLGPISNYVKFSADYQHVGKYLLNDMILVEDLHKALNIWQMNGHNKTLVTLDGEVINPHGVVTGGSASDGSKQFLERKREMAELATEVARLSQEVGTRNALLTDLRNRVQVNEARINQLKTTEHSQEVEFVHKERDILGLSQDLDKWQKDRDRLTIDTATISADRESGIKERSTLTEKVKESSLRQQTAETEISRLMAEAEKFKTEISAVSEELTAKKVQLASSMEQSMGLEREIKRLSDSIAEVNSSIASKMAEITDGNNDIEQTKIAISTAKEEAGQLVQEISSLASEQTKLKQDYDSSLEGLKTRELSFRESRKAFEELKSAIYELKLRETKQSEKVFYLEREIQERYHIDLASRHEDYKIDFGAEDEKQKLEKITAFVAELKEKVEKIGAVNADAIGEYESIRQRYEFLTKQVHDLQISLETLNKAIIRINRTSKERFAETFNAVNERFKTLFPRLFHGGGRAELILVDQENVLESGIEIIAQPPGKKLQSVGLLSGGEKALVAITFIFSIFLIKPSPFCLLDEVDAPLDDANIDRFNQLVKEMAKLSQFIMITHNRRSMELADTLYGVTMEEAGISKIVSVKLEHAGDNKNNNLEKAA